MSKLFFISDHHLGFDNILKYESELRPFDNIEDHNEWIIERHNMVVGPNDVTFFLGDVARHSSDLALLDRMAGRKRLILGNHDDLPLEEYSRYFEKVHWLKKKGGEGKAHWITHIPVHPCEFEYRVQFNIHGHLHARKLVDDHRYINVCVEQNDATPLTMRDWVELHRERRG